ncbi:hypothetical protein D9Q98_000035 [Chlorella vulgaris]|uniref:Uncharacterized protein n=1 Tax=Chlorella vulgaris TaxID=3077 RepID=A0A9D4TXN2_CHLVU|nr:hypothetical protein D9Q98_000035 [Chlorella vulgaris]
MQPRRADVTAVSDSGCSWCTVAAVVLLFSLAFTSQEQAGLQWQLEEMAAARWAAEQRQQLLGEQRELLLYERS